MLPAEQVPGVYHRRVGDTLVTALSDGYLDASCDVFRNLSEDEAKAVLVGGLQPYPPRISVNAFLVRSGGRTAIVDTGSSDCMGDTLGQLPKNMAAAGVAPEDVDTVLLTHMHPDHSGGLIDPAGNAFFPNAEVVVGEADYKLWHDDAIAAAVDERRRKRYFTWSRAHVAPYRDRLRWTPAAGGEVLPSVTTVPLPGHTPGHTGYLITSGGDSLLIWGDTVHVPGIQVPRPDTTMVFDWDPEGAIASRRRILEMVSAEEIPVAGMHVHFPGFANVARDGGSYRIVQEGWAHTV
ncbi:MBL fold metallo-hydrolase [Acuticoccus sp.]|uniref:MBL fold metallo-hydrolase n=1 Tax=Acuticoccus sp. TaxID=1904378 RepID=UPI003B5159C3